MAVVRPAHDDGSSNRIEVRADVGGDSNYEVTFWAKTGDDPWEPIGTDDNAPYRVFHDVYDLPPGTGVQYQAVVLDNAGHSATSDVRQGAGRQARDRWDAPVEGSNVRGATTLRVMPDPELSHYVVTFQRRIGDGSWTAIGADNSSPVYSVVDTLPTLPTGPSLYRAVLDYGGRTATSAERNVVVAPPPVRRRSSTTSAPTGDTPWGLHLFGDGSHRGRRPAGRRRSRSRAPTPTARCTGSASPTTPSRSASSSTGRHNTMDPERRPLLHAGRCPQIWLKQGDPTVYCSPPG